MATTQHPRTGQYCAKLWLLDSKRPSMHFAENYDDVLGMAEWWRMEFPGARIWIDLVDADYIDESPYKGRSFQESI